MSRSVWKRRNIGTRYGASVAAPPPGPPSKTNSGSGCASRRKRGCDDDLQIDRPPGMCVSVLEDLQLPAEGIGRTLGNVARMQTVQDRALP